MKGATATAKQNNAVSPPQLCSPRPRCSMQILLGYPTLSFKSAKLKTKILKDNSEQKNMML
jgi:hypothetical protein